ncbi:YbaB/EbfC family nucleoid-associated protein [Rhodococcus sp. HNM0569]|uniref:YbaB/EbfC family nucleoid-associated protein n=1 Tax=Rhodococcus sp. HNM0569 TaxID=2716340 RepID=UPI00146B87D8|nr:YbaB/EbfC family nucleoid-associated protein [Rhodococcus sp. HNM0569]NLU83604.1 YbaB/EbfC family nucleoid-associated protein [Rhodococcus sp. HNM0569]
MADQHTEQLRAQNDALERQVGEMLAQLEDQQREFADAQRRVAELRVWGESDDRMVRVQVDATGTVLDVVVAPEATRRSTPELLGSAMTQAARRAADSARTQANDAMASVLAIGDRMPDLPDLVPGAPSLRSMFDDFQFAQPDGPAQSPSPSPSPEPEADDDWGQSSFLKDPLR